MTMSLDAIQRKFATEGEKFKKTQRKYQKLISLQNQLETQMNENSMVKEELEFVKDDSRIYKLQGPVMVPQTLSEAKANVDRRISYINDEIKRTSDQIEKVKADLVTEREQLGNVEQQLEKLLVKAHASA